MRSVKSIAGPGFRACGLTLLAFSLVVVNRAWLVAADKAETNIPSTKVATASGVSREETRLREDVTFLSADQQEGRAPGTKGIEAAATYIADAFKGMGLKPPKGGDGYFQTFKVSSNPALGKDQSLAFRGPDGKEIVAKLKDEYSPLAIGSGGTLDKVPVVFAGYGISAKDNHLNLDYDDYAGIDVTGKAVLIIRREPQQDDEHSPFDGKKTSTFATFRHKASNAFQHGAAAVLLVNDAASTKTEKDQVLNFLAGGPDTNSNIPFLMLSRELGDALLKGAGQPSLAELEQEIDKDLKPRSRELKGWTLNAKVEIDRPDIQTKNVIGVIEGEGPTAEETVVVGAHYDHLGHGGLTSGSLAFLSSDIHNGADDNASGTSMIMELARRLAARRDPLPRRVVFIAFSGEERGLLGSRHYVENPLYPIDKTVMMINCDMVGRLNANRDLTMIGVGTSPGLDAIVDSLGKAAGFNIKKVSGMTDGFGGSDHQSFYGKNIPVLFAFTGVHSDYHRPSDDADRINYGGMARIANYLELLLLDIARRPDRPAFTAIKQPIRAGGADPARAGLSAYLGTMPDYADESKDGMKLAGVSEGSPAEKGGLKGGDTIIEFGKKRVGTIYDFMESMGRYKPGDVVDVVVKREGKDVKLKVTLGSRPNR